MIYTLQSEAKVQMTSEMEGGLAGLSPLPVESDSISG